MVGICGHVAVMVANGALLKIGSLAAPRCCISRALSDVDGLVTTSLKMITWMIYVQGNFTVISL